MGSNLDQAAAAAPATNLVLRIGQKKQSLGWKLVRHGVCLERLNRLCVS
jgi:hypothetical protein